MARVITNQKQTIHCKTVAEARAVLQSRRDCSAGYILYDSKEEVEANNVRPHSTPSGEELPTWARMPGSRSLKGA